MTSSTSGRGVRGSGSPPIDRLGDRDGLTNDKVLAHLRPGLLKLGYEVEGGKQGTERIRRPVLFGDQGRERVAYEVDAVHDELDVLVEVEAVAGGPRRRASGSRVATSCCSGQLVQGGVQAADLVDMLACGQARPRWHGDLPHLSPTADAFHAGGRPPAMIGKR